MPRNTFVALFGFLLLPWFLWAQKPHFEWNAEVDRAHDLVLQFRMSEAEKVLIELNERFPENRAVDYVWTDLYLIRTLVEEHDEHRAELYESYRDHLNRFFDLEKTSVWRSVVLGETYFKRGLVNTLNGNPLSAARDIYLGYQQFERAYELDSTFYPALLGWGVVQMYAGAIPDDYVWYARLIGISGDSEFGERLIIKAVEESQGATKNSFHITHIPFTANYLSIGQEIPSHRKSLKSKGKNSYPLILFAEVKNLVDDHNNVEAMSLLSQYRPTPDQMRFWYLDYLYGINLVRVNDPKGEKVLLNYLANYPGDSYKKSAALFLSWYYLMNGKEEESRYYKNRIDDLGKAFAGADKEAMNLKDVDVPIALLRARLLFDSGEYEAADSVLRSTPPESFEKDIDRQNWYYRNGQVHKALGDLEVARRSYQRVTELPFDTSRKFTPASCMEIGNIYFERQQYNEAIKWYDKALEYKGYPYVSDYRRLANRRREQAEEKLP